MSHITEGRYYIQLSTGRALEAASDVFRSNGAKIQTWKLYRGLNQLWDVRQVGPDTYQLFNVGGLRALDAHDADVNRNGCRIQLYDPHPENLNQQWILHPLGSNRYAIRCAASRSNKVIQIKDNVVDRSGEAELSDFLSAPSQIWTFTPASDDARVRTNLVDLRPNQTPIKDQGLWRGTCTYFGATAALEAAYKKAGYGAVNISEEFWSIMGKALGIHPYWSEIPDDPNYRENQFAGTQGGGTLLLYAQGFRVPLEADVAYRPADYVPSNWASLNQKEANDWNFSLFSRNVLQAPRYYGARSAVDIPRERLNNAAEYERLLRLGFEVSIYRDAHNVLLVGFDKTDAANPVFFVKNSYGPLGGDPTIYCERWPYSTVLDGGIEKAEYLTDVVEPAPWPELAFQGRWNLNFDGHKGTLDIYHMPGMGIIPLPARPVPNIIDCRLGVFYDSSGNAFRVNGSLSGNRIEFWFNNAKPHLPWNELSGRRFVYHLEPTTNIMTGLHYDGDGSNYGGYATKGNYLTHGTPSRTGFSALSSSIWDMMFGNFRSLVHFNAASDSSVDGTISLPGGGTRVVEANLLDGSQVSFWLEESSELATARFLNHEPGLLCGSTSTGRAFYAAYVSNR
jgi:hypothetical protein